MFEIDPAILSIVVGTILPVVVGIVTKQVASGALKSSLLALLSGAAGVANNALNDGGIFTKETLIAAAATWVTAVATYYGFLKPSGVSNAVNTKTANIGLKGKDKEPAETVGPTPPPV